MSDIGKMLYDRRKELGYTLEEVGNAVGVGKSTVRKWENGMIKNMGRDKIALLAKKLELSPVDFVPYDDGDSYSSLSDDERVLVTGYRALSSAGKEYMLQQLNAARVLYGGEDDPVTNENEVI